MQRIGLYHPYVHFRDQEWVKAAALYWPKLARVVPPRFRIGDPGLVRVLRDELDFVVDVDPREAAKAVAPAFLKVVEDHGPALARRFPAASYAQVPLASYLEHEGVLVPAAAGEPSNDDAHLALPFEQRRLVGLHPDEVEQELRAALREAGLAVDTPDSDRGGLGFDQWFATDPVLAWVYKCALTEELARRTGFTPTTDQVAAHTATDSWDSERIAAALLGARPSPTTPRAPHTPDAGAARLGLMAVRYVLPDGLAEVPVEKIVRLRRDHRAEFHAFTTAAEQAATDLRAATEGIADGTALEQYARLTFEQRLAGPLDELRGAMSGLNLKTVYSAMNYKFELPALVGAASGWAGNLPVAVGGLALAAVTMRRSTAEARDEQLAGSPMGYLLRVERELTPPTLVARVLRTAARAAGTGI